MDRFETVIHQVMSRWDGLLIFNGDFAIDTLTSSFPIATRYLNLISNYDLSQIVSKATIKGKTSIDHSITNYPLKVQYTDILLCSEISHHDAPYICMNARNRPLPSKV